MRCFLEKLSQLTKILHDRQSRRGRQISSLISPITNMETFTLTCHGVIVAGLRGPKTIFSAASFVFLLKLDISVQKD